MDEIINKLKETNSEITVKNCYGVYDAFIRIKYGVDPHDLAWVYLKENKIILMHIKNDNFATLDGLINRIKELKGVN
ncbi:MAG: hypothetical protein J6T10_27525 [Methanobrevibacter sp.]|nr:hypothetical protein [Methanobrevibacter sp.]